jgi:hypothetical protein
MFRSLSERFRRLTVPGPGGCTLWVGMVSRFGYGRMKIDGRRIGAHRVAWELANGPIPDGLFVCHKCDVRRCVNPDHLFLGTQADNMADRNSKGRQVRGEKMHWAKLTPDAIEEIRTGGRDAIALATKFGISRNHIYNIRNRRSWRHV